MNYKPYGIALRDNQVYVTGETESADFPTTANAVIHGYDGPGAFVASCDLGLSKLSLSTMLTTARGRGRSVVVTPSHDIYVDGMVVGPHLPSASKLCPSGAEGMETGFVLKLTPTKFGKFASNATFLGGGCADREEAAGIAFGSGGFVHITGVTKCDETRFCPAPVRAAQPAFGGVTDAFVSTLLMRTFIR